MLGRCHVDLCRPAACSRELVHRVAQVVPRALCEIEQAARDGLVELDSLRSK